MTTQHHQPTVKKAAWQNRLEQAKEWLYVIAFVLIQWLNPDFNVSFNKSPESCTAKQEIMVLPTIPTPPMPPAEVVVLENISIPSVDMEKEMIKVQAREMKKLAKEAREMARQAALLQRQLARPKA